MATTTTNTLENKTDDEIQAEIVAIKKKFYDRMNVQVEKDLILEERERLDEEKKKLECNFWTSAFTQWLSYPNPVIGKIFYVNCDVVWNKWQRKKSARHDRKSFFEHHYYLRRGFAEYCPAEEIC